jgi:hypothetical protein
VRRIGALASPRLQPAALLTALQQRIEQRIEQDTLDATIDAAGAKLAQRGVRESLVAQFQAQGILPVNAGPHRVCCLSITQVLERLA